jgi:U3 small nucleolar ribonucleoprotein protein LCP5
MERARKRALGSSVMQELQEEYFDRPSEVSHRDATKATLVQQLRHKEE